MPNTLEALMAQLQNAEAVDTSSQQKTAERRDEPPEAGHPATEFQDKAEIPEGPEINESDAEQKEMYGDVAAAAGGAINPDEDNPDHPGSEAIHPGGDDGAPELKPGEGVEDPGPDSEHPANTNNKAHKYADYTDPVALAAELEKHAQTIMQQLAADPSALASPLNKQASAEAGDSQDGAGPEDEMVDNIREMLPTEELQNAAFTKLAGMYSQYVAEGIDSAVRVHEFLNAVESKQAAGGDMPPEANAAAMGDMPVPPESDQEMSPEETQAAAAMAAGAGGGMGAGEMGAGEMGGENEVEQLLALVEEAAAAAGIPPEELLAEMLAEAGGGGEMAGGAAPMPAEEVMAAAGESMPPEAAMAEEVPPEAKAASAPRGRKTAAPAKSDPKSLRKLAAAFVNEAKAAQQRES